ncbi:MAG: hypothetical protein JRG97_07825 [Deltaproteobacteria bacterium]|nr:hypothetical protein [Deltaproteobacteria bacterium]MBW2051906.1 hypothetical protein [Deltaproteobacteria bacterium]MBW2140966.1 hypothetical protein [Deltaproteobacteria bacterium]
MKKLLRILLILCLFFGISYPSYGGDETFKGVVITIDGKYHLVGEFLDLKGESFYCRYNEKELYIPYAELKSITYLGDETVLILKRNGEELKVSKGYLQVGAIAYYNPMDMKYVTEMISNHLIKKIVFDDDFGEARKCPKCGKTYPADFLFCPYDKAVLKLIKIK